MSAPPGFNPNASLLPDPGPSAAPIQVMRGGAGSASTTETSSSSSSSEPITFTKDQLTELQNYQLGPGGLIADEFDSTFKQQFLKEISDKSRCRRTTGDTIILGRDCQSIVKVIRALLKAKITRTNRVTPIVSNQESVRSVTNSTLNIFNEESETGSERRSVNEPSEESPSNVNGNNLRRIFGNEFEEEPEKKPSEEPPSNVNGTNMRKLFENEFEEEPHLLESNSEEEIDSNEEESTTKCEIDYPDVYTFLKSGNYEGTSIFDILKEPSSSLRQQEFFKELKFDVKTKKINGVTIKRILVSCHPDKSGTSQTIQTITQILTELLKYSQPVSRTVNTPEESSKKTDTSNRMSAVPVNTPNPAATQEPIVNYPDEYYEENPSNFKPGHLRFNFQKEDFNAPGNRLVYANTTVGTRRTRIYGTNAANIKKKFISRTRKLKAAANRAAERAATAVRVASETRAAAQKAKNEREAAARAAANAKKTLRTMETTAAKQAAANQKAAIRAKIAAGERVSFMNRMRAKFGGGRRTRRKTRGSRKSRRGSRK